jgi:hypothetical protein
MLLIAVICIVLGVTEASPDAKRLYDDLLLKGAYNKLIRPVSNMSNILVVKLGLRLTQIIDVVSGGVNGIEHREYPFLFHFSLPHFFLLICLSFSLSISSLLNSLSLFC